MILSDFVKARRSTLGLSLQDVANSGKMSKQTVYDVEKGGSWNLEMKTLVSLARGLRVKPQVMFEVVLKTMEMKA